MRTTVTLDPDVAAAPKRTALERGSSFKQVLNDTIRSGLAAAPPIARAYRLPSRSMGLRPGIDVDKASALAAADEDEEILRKLELRK